MLFYIRWRSRFSPEILSRFTAASHLSGTTRITLRVLQLLGRAAVTPLFLMDSRRRYGLHLAGWMPPSHRSLLHHRRMHTGGRLGKEAPALLATHRPCQQPVSRPLSRPLRAHMLPQMPRGYTKISGDSLIYASSMRVVGASAWSYSSKWFRIGQLELLDFELVAVAAAGYYI